LILALHKKIVISWQQCFALNIKLSLLPFY